MESIFIILSWAILLVSGFDNSDPPTGDKTFKIEYSDTVQSIKTISDATLDFWGFDIELKQNSADVFDIKIPKNFPIPESFTNSWTHGGRPVIVGDKEEVRYEMVEEPCYFHYKIPVEGKTNLEIVYTVILTGKWQLHNSIQFNENDPCYNKVFYEPPIAPPLKQFKSGVAAEKVKCKQDLLLVIKSRNDSPACIKPKSMLQLVDIGWGNVPHAFETKTDLLNTIIAGGTINSFKFDVDAASILINLETASDGSLTMTIPKVLTNSMSWYQNNPSHGLLIDGQFLELNETITTRGTTVTIPFKEGTKIIEIVGTRRD